ncbi:MAG: OmpA family protein [Pseudomonadota bacterium]|nr:OmpA family protein [Pseudomonadota bacterium]
MMKCILLTVICVTVISDVSLADKVGPPSRQESIGVGTGAVLGGSVGGPFGSILGAALGSWLGDRFHKEQTAKLEFEQRWEVLRDEAEILNAGIKTREQEIIRFESELLKETAEMQVALQQMLSIQVLFRTGESDLDKINQDWFEQLAELLTNMDGMLIRVEGFADARGNVEYNAQLSADRALAVQDALIRAGVPSGRIVLDSYGEQFSRADESDLDGLAMERRVELSLVDSSERQRVARK